MAALVPHQQQSARKFSRKTAASAYSTNLPHNLTKTAGHDTSGTENRYTRFSVGTRLWICLTVPCTRTPTRERMEPGSIPAFKRHEITIVMWVNTASDRHMAQIIKVIELPPERRPHRVSSLYGLQEVSKSDLL
jgi:hypothetical protein